MNADGDPVRDDLGVKQFYWTALARGLSKKGLVETHRGLLAQLEEPPYAMDRVRVTKWLTQRSLERLPPLPDVEDGLLRLLLATVDVYRRGTPKRVGRWFGPRDPTGQLPLFEGTDRLRFSTGFWRALVKARAVTSAHRGWPFPIVLDEFAPDVHPYRSLIEKTSPDPDSAWVLQYWLRLREGQLEVSVWDRDRLVGYAVEGSEALDPQILLTARLRPDRFERYAKRPWLVQVPLTGDEEQTLTVVSPNAEGVSD